MGGGFLLKRGGGGILFFAQQGKELGVCRCGLCSGDKRERILPWGRGCSQGEEFPVAYDVEEVVAPIVAPNICL